MQGICHSCLPLAYYASMCNISCLRELWTFFVRNSVVISDSDTLNGGCGANNEQAMKVETETETETERDE